MTPIDGQPHKSTNDMNLRTLPAHHRPMRILLTFLLIFCACTSVPSLAKDVSLPRKAVLGAVLQPAPYDGGALVQIVIAGNTAEALSVRPGDVIVAVNGINVRTPGEVLKQTALFEAGKETGLTVVRNEERIRLKGRAVARPGETFSGATVDYGSLPFRDGRLRDILVMPDGRPDAPVVFFIQGYSCIGVEPTTPGNLFRRFGEELLRRGIGYYRVEKVGMGDSVGSLKCQEIDFQTEMEAFAKAYRHLVEDHRVTSDRVFIMGHSLGGIQAPLLAREIAPRGVAVYGTIVRDWADYHHDLDAVQPFIIRGEDPADAMAHASRSRDLFRLFFFEGMAPDAIAEARPDLLGSMKSSFEWDGTHMLGRSPQFLRQLAAVKTLVAWRDVKSNVLSLFGQSDLEALTDADQKYLVEAVNYWRPGSGEYVEFPDTDHGMRLSGSRLAIRDRNRAGGPPLTGEFNGRIVMALADWIERSMAKPPVRLPAGPAQDGPAQN